MSINIWTQDSEPTVGVGGMDLWFQPTAGYKWQRDTGNATWIFKGYINETYDGSFPRSGGAVTGAMTGPSGLAPVSDPDFQNSAKLEGRDLGRIIDIDALRTEFYQRIGTEVASLLSAQSLLSGVRKNLALDADVTVLPFTSLWNLPYTVPLPDFSDNVQATDSQVMACFAWVARFQYHESGDRNLDYYWYMERQGAKPSRTFILRQFNSYANPPANVSSSNWGVGYFIAAAR